MVINIHIGIDPDLIKSGVAVWDSKLKQFDFVKRMTFWEVIEEIDCWNIPVEVVIEAGWLNKPKNFHDNKMMVSASNAADVRGLKGAVRDSFINNYLKKTGEKVSANVGENHAVGKLLEQYCQDNKLRYRLVKPTTSKDYRKAIVNNHFKHLTTSVKDLVTNAEEIDAAFLVFQSQTLKIA
jgi:hypothetical protein